MQERIIHRIGVVLAVALAAAIAGCGAAASAPATGETISTAQAQPDYDYQAFAPLPEPVREGSVPFLLGPDGAEQMSCFEEVEEIKPLQGDTSVVVLFEKHAEVAKAAIDKWMVDTLAPDSVTSAMAQGWKLEIDDTVALEVEPDKMRFVQEPECIQQSTGWLPEEIRAVTALYGARTFRFQADPPVKAEVKEAIISGVQYQGLMIESDDLRDYEPLLDDKGEPKLDDKKQPLYTAPDGSLVPENKVPPPEKRTMSEWTLKSEKPLFFAFHELSEEAWRAETEAGICDVVLIWGDPKARTPECEQYARSSFLAAKSASGSVDITVQTGKESKKLNMSFGDTERVQVDERTLLWLSPEEAGEGLGVKIKLDSLVLNP